MEHCAVMLVSEGVMPPVVELLAMNKSCTFLITTMLIHPLVLPENEKVTDEGSPFATRCENACAASVPSSALAFVMAVQPLGGVIVMPVPTTTCATMTSL